jgi:hypothetical protein
MSDARLAKHKVRIGRYELHLPRSRFWRVALGTLLLLGGALWFLPVLGLWMLPLGLAVLSIDSHPVRRLRRRLETWWGRRRKNSRERPFETKKGPGG